MTNHIWAHSLLCKTWLYHPKNNAQLCPSLNVGGAEKQLHTFEFSNLEYWIPNKSIQKPQHIQISTTLFQMGVTRRSYHSPSSKHSSECTAHSLLNAGSLSLSPINVSMELPQPTTKNSSHTLSCSSNKLGTMGPSRLLLLVSGMPFQTTWWLRRLWTNWKVALSLQRTVSNMKLSHLPPVN